MPKYIPRSIRKENLERYQAVIALAEAGGSAFGISKKLDESLTTVQHWFTVAGVKSQGTLKVGNEGELAVLQKLETLGIRGELTSHGHPFDIKLENGLRIEVKTCISITTGFKKPNVTFNACSRRNSLYGHRYKKNYARDCDIVIMAYRGEAYPKRFWVCRPADLPKSGSVRIALEPNRVLKWHQFENRFDLIAELAANA